MFAKESDYAVRGIITKKSAEVLCGFFGDLHASGKEIHFIERKRGFHIIGRRDEHTCKLVAIIKGKVGSFSRERRHQMCRIAKQRHAGYSSPLVFDWQRINWAKHGIGLTLCDKGG